MDENKKYGKGIFCSKRCQIGFAFENKKEEATKKAVETNTLKRFQFVKKCNKCNKDFEVQRGINKDNSIHIFKGEKNFCSRTCANSRGTRTEEFKEKVRLKLKKHNPIFCIVCNKTIKIKGKTKMCLKCFRTTPEGIDYASKLGKVLFEKRRHEHKGWQSRNIISYPEEFFIKVLRNNNLSFKHNFPIKQKDLGLDSNANYFLDFYFEDIKLDLEIDGKQHNSRKEHDKKRDEALSNYGITVYRIEWKNINTEKGKNYIKDEINKFLEFYENM
jgi:very-short-patch-repair endonuclease